MVINRTDRIAYMLFFLFFISCVFDPADIFGMKKVLFVLIFSFCVFLFLQNRMYISKKRIIISAIFFSFGLIGFLFSALNFRGTDYDGGQSIAYLLVFFLFFLIIFLNNPLLWRAFIDSLAFVGLLMILYTIIISFLFAFFYNEFSSLFFYLNYTLSNSFITSRVFGPFTISMVYLKSIVLLFPISVIYYHKYKSSSKKVYFIFVILALFSLILSGTRTNIILSILMLLVLGFVTVNVKYRKYVFLGFLLLTLLVMYNLLTFVFENSDSSSEIKSSLLNTYLDVFFNDNSYFIIGDGFGSLFYAVSKNRYIFNSELVYLDVFKYLGGFVFLFFMSFLITPLLVFIRKNDVFLLMSYLSYLLVSATNPLLLSSTGMVALIYYFNCNFYDRPLN
ncbi:O-antigen polymerase [Photobacterium leiognathi]|uniref:O-antigen polymerase n=1 Tax=Photobacterium leiognathi TaxID=553611 RepID=UPI003AF35028